MSQCNDCGSTLGRHGCTWCFESEYIADQYADEGLPVPRVIQLEVQALEEVKPYAERETSWRHQSK